MFIWHMPQYAESFIVIKKRVERIEDTCEQTVKFCEIQGSESGMKVFTVNALTCGNILNVKNCKKQTFPTYFFIFYDLSRKKNKIKKKPKYKKQKCF